MIRLASFELMARRALGEVPDYFSIGRFQVMDEQRSTPERSCRRVEATTTITIAVINPIVWSSGRQWPCPVRLFRHA